MSRGEFQLRMGLTPERWLVCEWGVDINDMWTVAVALEHGLVLITRDKLTKVRAVMPELKVENWL